MSTVALVCKLASLRAAVHDLSIPVEMTEEDRQSVWHPIHGLLEQVNVLACKLRESRPKDLHPPAVP